MKRISKIPLSGLLALVMAIGLFAAFPATALAANAHDLADKINNFDHGGDGPLNAAEDGNTVTVTGNVSGAANILNLNIDNGVTIIWEAEYSGDCAVLFSVYGEGAFEIQEGGTAINTGGTVFQIGGIAFKLNGGAVSAGGNGFAVATGTAANSIEINGGAMDAKGTAINAQHSKITVSGGAVSSETGFAITNIGSNSSVTVTGGTLKSNGNTNAIQTTSIVMDDGIVQNSGDLQTISASGDFVLNGGEVTNTGNGNAVHISGDFIMNGGKASALKGCAVWTSGTNASISMNGGFAFAYGKAISGDIFTKSEIVVYSLGGTNPTEIGGTCVVCAWNQSAGNTAYNEGASDDLTVAPSSASVKWGVKDGQSGINYANGANTGFYPISGVAVIPVGTSGGTGDGSGGGTDGGGTGTGTGDGTGSDSGSGSGTGTGSDGGSGTGTGTGADGGTNGGPVSGAPSGASMSNFKKVNTYTVGLFTDVDEDMWYGFNETKAVANAYEYGLMKGAGGGLFNPDGDITVAEAVTIAARVHSIYTTGKEDFEEATGEWYEPYVDYAVKNGIIAAGAFQAYDRAAARAQMAAIFARSLPESELAPLNVVYSLPDVGAQTPNRDEITMLYRAGVLAGNDAAGTFNPGDGITRAEAAAIISRVILPDARIDGRTYG